MKDLRFHFGPLETRGVLLGLRGGQLALIIGAAAGAVMCVAALPLAFGGALAVAMLTAGLAGAFLDVAGRGVDEWLPVGARHAARCITAAHRRVSREHESGHLVRADGAVEPPRQRSHLRLLRHLAIEALPDGPQDRELGVVVDALRGTSTAVIAVRGGGFVLLGEHEKERRLAGWAAAMEAQCRDGSRVHRLQWVERSVAGGLNRVDDLDRRDDALHASNRDLLEEPGPSHQTHELLVAVQIRWSSCARAIRAADRRNRRRGAAVVLAREVDALLQRLPASGAESCRALGAEECARQLGDHLGVANPAGAVPVDPAVCMAPMATLETWDHVVVDGMEHATYWIREWPRVDVGPDFLGPLLLQTAVTRTVAVTMAFDPPRRAQRQAETSLTADLADDDVRRRAGFVSGFRRRRERDDAARRGEEIADGHGSIRFSGYITVSVPVDARLADACADVERRAQHSHLDIQRLYGQQIEALTYTLPLAAGLR